MVAMTSPTSKKHEMNHPTIVIGWATVKDSRLAMFNSRAKLANSAKTNDRPLTPSNL